MLCKKTSAITYQKIGPVTPGSDPPPGCVARGAGCTIVSLRECLVYYICSTLKLHTFAVKRSAPLKTYQIETSAHFLLAKAATHVPL